MVLTTPPTRVQDPAVQAGGGGADAVGTGAVAGGESAQDIRLPQSPHELGAQAQAAAGPRGLQGPDLLPGRDVFNHCGSNMDAIRQPHNDALEQVAAKIRGALDSAKLTVEYTGAALQPDIVLRNVATKKMVIADLAVTSEEHTAGARHSAAQPRSQDTQVSTDCG
ncbi:unnamed protein product [Phytophthora fragariaefolia]|uniref:Unnamed protein product n=1 Tax=Phytophthora fragariaefolia TaxID=1490495 RepID=A0A9W7D818_9STRA|nr:unnamed protein product [Phytophthora fragariaefolia]